MNMSLKSTRLTLIHGELLMPLQVIVLLVTAFFFKGKTYWFASDREDGQLGMFLVSFDYATERFGRL